MNHAADSIADLPPVPPQVTSFLGLPVSTNARRWELRQNLDTQARKIIDLARLDKPDVDVFNRRAKHLIVLFLAHRVAQMRAATVRNGYSEILLFGQWLGQQKYTNFDWGMLDESLARAWIAWLDANRATRGAAFVQLRVFYAWGVIQKFPDFDPKVHDTLQSLAVPCHQSGHHTRFRDSTRGAFSDDELDLLWAAWIGQNSSVRNRIVVGLCLSFGSNTDALTRLKNGDFSAQATASGGIRYTLRFPIIKQRGIQRMTTEPRELHESLGALIQREQQGNPDDSLLHWLPRHNPDEAIRKALLQFVSDANIISPRTGERLHVFPRRFRYSLASGLAASGASAETIGHALTHSNAQSAHIYVESGPRIVESVAEATEDSLNPYAARCTRRVEDAVPENTQVMYAVAPHLSIPLLADVAIGYCTRVPDRDGQCRGAPPLACYSCPFFVALRGGPHEEFLAQVDRQPVARNLSSVREGMRAIVELIAKESNN